MALIVAKVTILTPIGGKYVTETCIDTDSDHVSLYGDIHVWCALQCNAAMCYIFNTANYYYGRAEFIVLSMEEDEEMAGRH